MPLSEKDKAALENIGRIAQGGAVQPSASATAPKPKVSSTADFKSNYSNLTNKDWNDLFLGEKPTKDGESIKDMYFDLMDGKHYNALASMSKDKGQQKTYTYWKNTYQKGKELAQFFNDNRKTLTESQAKELNKLTNEFLTSHTLAERSSYEVWDKNVDDYRKLKPDEKKPITFNNKNRYLYDPEERALITQAEYEERSNDIFRAEDFYTNLNVKKDISYWKIAAYAMTSNPSILTSGVTQDIQPDQGYKSFMRETNRIKPELKSKVNYVLKNMTEQSLSYINDNHKNGFRDPIEFQKNRKQAGYLVQDILKEALVSPNEDVRRDALALNKEINRKGISFEERTAILKTPTFVRRISTLVSSDAFAHASKVNLYKKHKEAFGSPKYINPKDLEAYAKEKNIDVDVAVGQRFARLDREINMYLDMSKQYKDDYRKTKETFINELVPKNNFQEYIKENMFSTGKDLISFEHIHKNLPNVGRESKFYTPAVQKWEKRYLDLANIPGGYGRGMRAGQLATQGLSKKEIEEVNLFQTIYGSSPDWKDYGKKVDLDSGGMVKWRDEYNALKANYKQKYNDFQGNLIYAESSMNAGLNTKGQYALEQRSIDLNRSTIKSNNARNFIDTVTSLTETSGSSVYVKSGKWDHTDSIEDFQEEDSSAKGNKLITTFFKNKDKHKYDMHYVNTIKDSGQALYMFTNLTTKEKISIVLPKSIAKESKEQFASNEYNDDDDYHFDIVGVQPLKYYGADKLKYTRDAQIVYNKNTHQKELHVNVFEPDEKGILQTTGLTTIPLGANQYLTLDNAVAKAMKYLNDYEVQYK